MNSLNLTAKKIYNKQFDHIYNGYDSEQIDKFLDLVIEDYQTMETNVKELLDLVDQLQQEVLSLHSKNHQLENDMKINLSNTTQYSNVDLLKRISRLEESLYNTRK